MPFQNNPNSIDDIDMKFAESLMIAIGYNFHQYSDEEKFNKAKLILQTYFQFADTILSNLDSKIKKSWKEFKDTKSNVDTLDKNLSALVEEITTLFVREMREKKKNSI